MPYSRISGRLGQQLDLNVTFYNNGVPADPYALRRIDIYRGSVKDENLVAQIVISAPDDPSYPYPLVREEQDGTEVPTEIGIKPGVYHYLFDVPATLVAPDIYFDVWHYIGAPLGAAGLGSGSEGTFPDWDDETRWQSQCNKFWLYSDSWSGDSGLIIPRLGFEPLDYKLKKPEIRTMEVGIMPLPLYDFDYAILQVIPQLQAFIRMETENCEVLSGWEERAATIGIRQGTYRSNPFTVQFQVDTANFLIGTYRYRVILKLPNGEKRVSDDLRLMII